MKSLSEQSTQTSLEETVLSPWAESLHLSSHEGLKATEEGKNADSGCRESSRGGNVLEQDPELLKDEGLFIPLKNKLPNEIGDDFTPNSKHLL